MSGIQNFLASKHRHDHSFQKNPEVFTDIANTLIVGEPVIRPEDLKDGPTQSIYKAEHPGGLREQRRDTAKYVEKDGVGIVLIGLEDPSAMDPDMVFRVMGYDYGSYRGQMDAGKNRYPVITGVLYYGEQPWKAPCTIREAVEVPEAYRKIFSDYRIHVIDVPRLPEEAAKEYLAQYWK